MQLKTIINHGTKLLKQKSPIILAGVAVFGVGATIVTAIYCDRKAQNKVEEAKEKEENEDFKDFTTKEKVKMTWSYYVPVAAVGGITIGSIIMSKRIDMKRQAALMALYTATTDDFKEYRSKVVEMFGKEKDKSVKDEMAKEKIKNIKPGQTVYMAGGVTKVLCYDSFTGREFECDRNLIDSARNEINHRLVYGAEEYITLNEFYDYIELENARGGEEVGWDCDNLMELDYSCILDEKGIPVLVVDYNCGPLWDRMRKDPWKPSSRY